MERQADWRQEKAQALARARVVVIKVGSAVLTDAQGLSTPVLESLARQMAALRTAPDGHERRLVLVSSGAVAAGRAVLRAHGHSGETSGLSARQAAAAVGQGQLMRAWDEVFRAYDFPTSQVLLTRDDLRARQRFLNARNTFAELMDWGVLPIVNENDTVSVSELKFGDNDCLASLLVNLIGADLYINLTSAPGVYAANPQEVPDAGILECVEDVAGLDLGRMCGGKTSVGTGGMYSKLQAARRAAQLGVPTLILPGRETDVLARAFGGEAVGTWVRPEEHAIPRRKFWLPTSPIRRARCWWMPVRPRPCSARAAACCPAVCVRCWAIFKRARWCAWPVWARATATPAWAWACPITVRRICARSWACGVMRWPPSWAMPTIPRSSIATTCSWMPPSRQRRLPGGRAYP